MVLRGLAGVSDVRLRCGDLGPVGVQPLGEVAGRAQRVVVEVLADAFALILVGAALIPAPIRAGEALDQSAVEPGSPTTVPP